MFCEQLFQDEYLSQQSSAARVQFERKTDGVSQGIYCISSLPTSLNVITRKFTMKSGLPLLSKKCCIIFILCLQFSQLSFIPRFPADLGCWMCQTWFFVQRLTSLTRPNKHVTNTPPPRLVWYCRMKPKPPALCFSNMLSYCFPLLKMINDGSPILRNSKWILNLQSLLKHEALYRMMNIGSQTTNCPHKDTIVLILLVCFCCGFSLNVKG